ncbi:MAG: Lipoprotein-releasing system transmembrane protein LolE [Candidatus Anoxychlamydiales bacterium]|nr:Lipoprotein-releasing system transmembrane protein LolE [Candidatus Anoxychlamydiales bacterium]
MFELKLALKYLVPKKRRLSSSLISLISIFVITIVVWLVIVFLSVTSGIEKNWLDKLTTINAPIRISPSNQYFSSYYYKIDTLSSNSDFQLKTINEKLNTSISDPYDPEMDMEIPSYFPKPVLDENNKLLDPIKKADEILSKIKKEKAISFQDFEVSSAMLRLNLDRISIDPNTLNKEEKLSFLTQMSYVLSLCDDNPKLKSIILPLNSQDIFQLAYKANRSFENAITDQTSFLTYIDKNSFSKNLTSIFENIKIKKIKILNNYKIDTSFLLKNKAYSAYYSSDNSSIYITKNSKLSKGKILFENNNFIFKDNKNKKLLSNENIYIKDDSYLGNNFLVDYKNIKTIKDLKILCKTNNFKKDLRIPFYNLDILDFTYKNLNDSSISLYQKNSKISLPKIEDFNSIILPKSYKKNNVLVGDRGYLSYTTLSAASSQEMRIPIYVAGFYDPGVFPIGNRCIITDPEIPRQINSLVNNISYDNSPTNGIFVWLNDIKKTNEIKTELIKEFKEAKILDFFDISTYKDFEFSKDMMQQFQSDKTLFTLIAIIILIAACSNIISMLVLLVNDKKKEIAILRSMGTSKKSIALIFGLTGAITGIISSLLGFLLAVFTLKNLNFVINILSKIQGHSFFNENFFGSTMPNTLSVSSLIFIIVTTTVLSILAGLVPAIKATLINPSKTLR